MGHLLVCLVLLREVLVLFQLRPVFRFWLSIFSFDSAIWVVDCASSSPHGKRGWRFERAHWFPLRSASMGLNQFDCIKSVSARFCLNCLTVAPLFFLCCLRLLFLPWFLDREAGISRVGHSVGRLIFDWFLLSHGLTPFLLSLSPKNSPPNFSPPVAGCGLWRRPSSAGCVARGSCSFRFDPF